MGHEAFWWGGGGRGIEHRAFGALPGPAENCMRISVEKIEVGCQENQKADRVVLEPLGPRATIEFILLFPRLQFFSKDKTPWTAHVDLIQLIAWARLR